MNCFCCQTFIMVYLVSVTCYIQNSNAFKMKYWQEWYFYFLVIWRVHCTDTDLTVAEVVLGEGLDSALQPPLSSTAQAERKLLMNALDDIELNDARDTRWIRGGPSSDIQAADIYNACGRRSGGLQWCRSTGGLHGLVISDFEDGFIFFIYFG